MCIVTLYTLRNSLGSITIFFETENLAGLRKYTQRLSNLIWKMMPHQYNCAFDID